MKTLTTKIKKLQKLIYSPIVRTRNKENTQIMRIEAESEFTRIDFAYQPPSYYTNGGWVQIERDSFIRPVGTNQRLTMVKAVNIPIAPIKHYFKTSKDVLYYTLYFPALPKDTAAIDIIEKEIRGDYNWFNFYGVSMQKVKTERIYNYN